MVTKKNVFDYLCDVKKLVKEDKYIVSLREKNQKLEEKYFIPMEKVKMIIYDLEVYDFSCILNNDHEDYKDEKLYVFGKDALLYNKETGVNELVSLYIKFNKLNNAYLIVISFHEQEYKLKYMFKE